jgi:hypothetical protein
MVRSFPLASLTLIVFGRGGGGGRRPGGSGGSGRSRFSRGSGSIGVGMAEVVVRLHEVVNREAIIAVVQARAAPDDLLELDHRVHRADEDDVLNVRRLLVAQA